MAGVVLGAWSCIKDPQDLSFGRQDASSDAIDKTDAIAGIDASDASSDADIAGCEPIDCLTVLGGCGQYASCGIQLDCGVCPDLARIELALDPQPRLHVGDSAQLRARYFSEDDHELAASATLWESLDTELATIDTDGKVSGLRSGRVTIRATAGPIVEEIEVELYFALVSVHAGERHSCGLAVNGRAYCWGNNRDGQLGLGDGGPTEVLVPAAVSGNHRFQAIDTGGAHTCALELDGTLYCWGSNTFGQLGDFTTDTRAFPAPVDSALKFTSLSTGLAFGCAIAESEVAYCWGRNATAQAGRDPSQFERERVLRPWRVGDGTLTFVQITAGHEAACARTDAGQVYCWGSTADGKLGAGDSAQSYRLAPQPVTTDARFSHLTAGSHHFCAVASQPAIGKLWCWGRNTAGQLGFEDSTARNVPSAASEVSATLLSVAAGGQHSCARTTDESVLCWGANDRGQLGVAPGPWSSTGVAVELATRASSVSAGGEHSCAIDDDGATFCWGFNATGQLGDATQINSEGKLVKVVYP